MDHIIQRTLTFDDTIVTLALSYRRGYDLPYVVHDLSTPEHVGMVRECCATLEEARAIFAEFTRLWTTATP